MIQLDHIDVTFQQKKRQIQAVKDVTIHINEGDIYGIVGYSGAGKSTLVRVINLLQVPSAGTITVDGDVIYQDRVTLKPAALREKRRDIGMIFQHFNLMAQMTVAENVAFALKHSNLNKEQRKNSGTNALSSTVLVESAVRNSQAGWCVRATKMLVNCMVESPLTGKIQKFKANCGMGKCTFLTSGLQSMSTMLIQALSEKTGLMEHHANAMSTVEILSVTVAS